MKDENRLAVPFAVEGNTTVKPVPSLVAFSPFLEIRERCDIWVL
jgi:hypothetical protein